MDEKCIKVYERARWEDLSKSKGRGRGDGEKKKYNKAFKEKNNRRKNEKDGRRRNAEKEAVYSALECTGAERGDEQKKKSTKGEK